VVSSNYKYHVKCGFVVSSNYKYHVKCGLWLVLIINIMLNVVLWLVLIINIMSFQNLIPNNSKIVTFQNINSIPKMIRSRVYNQNIDNISY
jgi:hypothetical protein